VSVVAKVEPHVIACIAQMLKVTFQLGAAICPMVIPSPLYSQLNYPIPFSEMDATFAVPVSDPEVCNIEPDSGVVELGDSVDVTWNTSWGAPDPCDCRADIWFRTRVDQMSSWLPWEPIVPVHDTLNTGSVKWYVDAPLWHQAQIRVRFKDPDDSVLAIDTGGIFTIGFGASVETPEDLPKEFALLPAYPNPFIGGVTIEFTVPTIRNVRVRIYDARGRLVRDLLDGPVAPGHRVIIWDGDTNAGKDAGPGVYFVAVESPEKRLTQKIELLK
jgi:hypothetical protein